MMVVIVNSFWNEVILPWLALKNRVEDTSVFGGDFRTSSCELNSVFGAMEAVGSRNSDNGLFILPNKAKGILVDDLCYRRIPH
jgi:hypothetical protein